MNTAKFEFTCKLAIAKYGNDSQLNQLQEECAELIAAINHLRRKRNHAHYEVVYEMADVFIMLYQIIEGTACRMQFENAVDEKINRLNEKLKLAEK